MLKLLISAVAAIWKLRRPLNAGAGKALQAIKKTFNSTKRGCIEHCPPPKPSITIGQKIEKQLAKRGWTKDSVDDAVSNPQKTIPTRDVRHLPDGRINDEPATAFFSKEGGYVVRNDLSGDIVQVSNRLDPNWKAPF